MPVFEIEPEVFSFEDGEWLSEVNRSSAEYIKWVQTALNRILGLRLVVDGRMGPKTRSAVRSFQQRVGISVDGRLGPQTEAKLIAAGAGSPPGTGGTPTPAPGPLTGPGFRSCPGGGGTTSERCSSVKACDPLPTLRCVQHIDGVPFEYVFAAGKDAGTGLMKVTKRDRREQKFVQTAHDALRQFVAGMSRFGMPIEAILTLGSYVCRCIKDTNTLSNHSFGDAIDIVGVRWKGSVPGTLPETIIHNFRSSDAKERKLIQRIDACLRLSFKTVLDYNYNSDHENHYHCDTNRGKQRSPRGRATLKFLQDVFGIPKSGTLDAATQRRLLDLSGATSDVFSNDARFNALLDSVFARIAAGG